MCNHRNVEKSSDLRQSICVSACLAVAFFGELMGVIELTDRIETLRACSVGPLRRIDFCGDS